MDKTRKFKILGVGFGPANIALAAALEESGLLKDAHFFERAKETTWQPGMLINNSDIQNHPLRDLVTPRNPKSHYSFTNFLHVKGRLFEYLNTGLSYPYRIEYEQYVCWVASHFKDHVSYGINISKIEPLFSESSKHDVISGYRVIDQDGNAYECEHLVVAPGRTRYVPVEFEPLLSDRVVHLCDYLPAVTELASGKLPERICVIGGSQSAVELTADLADRFPLAKIHAVHRAYGFRQKDVSPFTNEVYFPEFVDEFYQASDETRSSIRGDLHLTNYSSSDLDVLDALYRKIYVQKIQGKQRIFLHRRSFARPLISFDDGRTHMAVCSRDRADEVEMTFDLVVLATGFKDLGVGEGREKYPAVLSDLVRYSELDRSGVIQVNRDYSVSLQTGYGGQAKCFLNGLCESTHGMGDAGSFSLLSLRSSEIIESIRSTENDVSAPMSGVKVDAA